MTTVTVLKQKTFTGHRDCVYTLQPSSNNAAFFSGAGDGMVVYWNLEAPDEGRLIARLPNSIYALHYHVNSNLLIAGHNYDGIHLLDWENNKEVASLRLTASSIFDIGSMEDLLFVATGEGTIVVVNMTTLSVINTIKHSEKSARTITFNAKLGEMAVGYSDHYIRIYDFNDMSLKFAWKAHDNSVFTLKYSPDGAYLFSGSRDARLKIWDIRAGYVQAEEVVAHMYAINHLDFSPDGKHFVTCSMDKSVKIWDTETVRLLKVIDKARHAGHGTSVNRLLWTSHRNQLITASDDRTISIWNINFETN